MSETTISFTGTAAQSDWNTASNWTPATVPNAANVTAVDDTSGVSLFIAGGSSDVVGTLDISTTSYGVFVGGSQYGGTGSGTLTATTINAPTSGTGVLVSTQGSTINASSITGTDIGGGGTFNAPIDNAGGAVVANGGNYGLGTLILNGSGVTGGGSIQIYGGSALELNEPTAETVSVNTGGTGPSAELDLDNPTSFTGTLDIPSGYTLDLFTPTGETINSATVSGSSLILNTTAGTETFALAGTGYGSDLVAGGSGSTRGEVAVGPGITGVVCYAGGTRIATPDGDVAVETLRAGDRVLTADGRALPVTWIGRRRADCRRHPEPRKVWPVRIQAGAFGPGLPTRDLRVSPQHGIYAEGVLIPAKVLVNGSTVRQEHVASVEYFHVELERHEILLAEGLPAESYLDTGDRAAFENGGAPIVLYPDFARLAWDAHACAELKVVGPAVERTRARLARHAKQIAATQAEPEPAAG